MRRLRSQMTHRYCYLATTADKYELPIAVADTVPELARILGVKTSSVYEGLSQNKYKRKNKKYHAIQI